MSTYPFTRMVASGLLATAIGGGAMTPSQNMPRPVTSVQAIAGAAPTEPVRWRGHGWGYRGYGWGYGGYRGYGWGWRRPNYGGAIAAGAIAGGTWGSLGRPAPPTTAMATRLITATTQPTDPCMTGQRTTDRPIIVARTPGPSIIAAPTGGLSTTAEHITGQRTSTDVRTTGVRTGGDEDKRADTIAPGPEASPELELGSRAALATAAGLLRSRARLACPSLTHC